MGVCLGWESCWILSLSLSFFLCLWKDRLPCHFSMCLGRQTSVLFCKSALQDRLVCGLFMLIGIKCYKDGDKGNLQIFCGSVSIGFLDVACLLLSLPKCWGRLALTPSLGAPSFCYVLTSSCIPTWMGLGMEKSERCERGAISKWKFFFWV